jgi:AAA domain
VSAKRTWPGRGKHLVDIAPPRDQLAQAVALRAELAELGVRNNRLHNDVLNIDEQHRKVQQALADADPERGLKRWRGRKDRQRLAIGARNLANELARATDRSAQANDLLSRQRELLRPQNERLVAAAAPVDDAEVARREAGVVEAETTVRAADHTLRQATTRLEVAREKFANAEREPVATEEDVRLVDEVERNGLPALAAQRENLQRAVAPLLEQRKRLEEEHERLLSELHRERTAAEPQVIAEAKAVATTYDASYDVVLVDEAAAALLSELVLAAAKAKRTLVLLGDFCQLGPDL